MRPQKDALFEQAIFFVKDNAQEVTEQQLLRQAKQAAAGDYSPKPWHSLIFFLGGSLLTGAIWLLTAVL